MQDGESRTVVTEPWGSIALLLMWGVVTFRKEESWWVVLDMRLGRGDTFPSTLPFQPPYNFWLFSHLSLMSPDKDLVGDSSRDPNG